MESAEARPILAAAEAAAAIDDYATAERLLREAADVQERTLGPAHPDLANTFNNLGVICERAGKIDEAEASYRRAHAIATSAFPADHPFVATSRQNLEEFCAANGRSIEAESQEEATPIEPESAAPGDQVDVATQARGAIEPVPPVPAPGDSPRAEQGPAYTVPSPPIQPPRPAPAAAPMRLQLDAPELHAKAEDQGPAYPPPRPAQPDHAAERVAVAHRVPDRPSRVLPLGALAVLVISFAIVLVGLMAWPSRTSEDTSTGAESSSAAPADTTPTPATPAEPTTPARPVTPPPARVPSVPSAVTSDRRSPNTTVSGLTLTDVRLCRTLSTRGQWECTPLGDPATPGPMVFYTRIVAPRPTKVEHRWYFGNRLEQSVTLDIQPNSGGYRTFSRRTSNPRLAGQWRVELRSEDGQLLREERFVVSK